MSDSSKTRIIGILNVTPDSFSDGGRYLDLATCLNAALLMRKQGADLIDIGAVSTRPGAIPVSSAEEVARLRPVLEVVTSQIDPMFLCVDAASTEAIDCALKYEIGTLNLCGGLPANRELGRRMSEAGTAIIVYPGHDSCVHPDSLQGRVEFFSKQQTRAGLFGIPPHRLLLDPGIGFGQEYQDCVLLLRNLHQFARFSHPLVIGVSRKNHLARLLGQEPSRTGYADRLEAGLAAAAVAVLTGAHYVRTHDVQATKRFFTVFDQLRSFDNERYLS